jgi:hypothetical protein
MLDFFSSTRLRFYFTCGLKFKIKSLEPINGVFAFQGLWSCRLRKTLLCNPRRQTFMVPLVCLSRD